MWLHLRHLRHLLCINLFLLARTSSPHPHYVFEIPNANNIFHNGQLIGAIGHDNPHGHGKLSAFGIDFMKEGRTWTQKLCRMDSDDDGQSNGRELGDPACQWKRNKQDDTNTFHTTKRYTHPGLSNENNWPLPNEHVEVEIDALMEEEDVAEEEEDLEEEEDWNGESFEED